MKKLFFIAVLVLTVTSVFAQMWSTTQSINPEELNRLRLEHFERFHRTDFERFQQQQAPRQGRQFSTFCFYDFCEFYTPIHPRRNFDQHRMNHSKHHNMFYNQRGRNFQYRQN